MTKIILSAIKLFGTHHLKDKYGKQEKKIFFLSVLNHYKRFGQKKPKKTLRHVAV